MVDENIPDEAYANDPYEGLYEQDLYNQPNILMREQGGFTPLPGGINVSDINAVATGISSPGTGAPTSMISGRKACIFHATNPKEKDPARISTTDTRDFFGISCRVASSSARTAEARISCMFGTPT